MGRAALAPTVVCEPTKVREPNMHNAVQFLISVKIFARRLNGGDSGGWKIMLLLEQRIDHRKTLENVYGGPGRTALLGTLYIVARDKNTCKHYYMLYVQTW